jgi:hypothetical protein
MVTRHPCRSREVRTRTTAREIFLIEGSLPRRKKLTEDGSEEA